MTDYAILPPCMDRPGILFGLTKVLAEHDANITYVDIHAGDPDVGDLLRGDAAGAPVSSR